MKARLDHVESIAAGIKTFWFAADKPVRYTAGQFTELHVPHAETDKRGAKRWFTLSSSPSEELLAITTKFAPSESSTFKRSLAHLRLDTEVTLAEPMGDFVLPKDPLIPLLFVVSGIGVTPVRSMVKWLLDRHEQRDIRILYTAHTTEELAFLDLFEQYDVPLTRFITSTGGCLKTADILAAHAVMPASTLTYLSGPEQMVEVLTKELWDAGTPKEQIVTDYFHGYQSV